MRRRNYDVSIRFQDRIQAGRLLAAELMSYANRKDVLVLGLPRGGVPVAFEVAKELKAPLDVFLVRKLGLPGREELAMGAIATGGVRVLNQDVVLRMGISQETIDAVAAVEERELQRRELAYRGHGRSPEIGGKTVILVDDGIATGSTMRAAVEALRRQHPQRVVIGIPIGPPSACNELERHADEVVALMRPEGFLAVGEYYEAFSQTTDGEVIGLLEQAQHGLQGAQTPHSNSA